MPIEFHRPSRVQFGTNRTDIEEKEKKLRKNKKQIRPAIRCKYQLMNKLNFNILMRNVLQGLKQGIFENFREF